MTTSSALRLLVDVERRLAACTDEGQLAAALAEPAALLRLLFPSGEGPALPGEEPAADRDAARALLEAITARATTTLELLRLRASERRARAERAEERMQLQTILDHTPAFIYLADRDGRLVLVNRAFERRTGRPASELIGLTVADFMTGEEAARVLANDRRVVDENRAFQLESTFLEGGRRVTYFSLKFPVTDERGAVRGVGAIATDITERKEAEEALRHAQERFEKVFRSSLITVCISDLESGRILDVNAAFEGVSGYSIEESLGRTVGELGLWARPDDRAAAIAQLQREGSVRAFETVMRHRHGSLRDVQMSLELIELDGRKVLLSLVSDVTERKQIEERLVRAQRMEALGRLAGGVAHDFNNILTAISGYAGLILDRAPPSTPLHEQAAQIERSAARAAAITRQLLAFGQKEPRRPLAVELNVVVADLLGMLRPLLPETVRLETSLDPDAGCVRVDPSQLEQVILNLALNARDAMPRGGRMRITTSAFTDGAGVAQARISVEDEGAGMDAATRARIFEPFFTTKTVGTGLGLSTVYGIIEQSGGEINVSSAPGRGARFDVILPRTATSSIELSPAAAPAPTLPPGGSTVLVVEDDPAIAEFVALVLRTAGYQILVAGDGEAAIATADAHPGAIDLLLTDILMPNRDGPSLSAELRRRRPGLRVVYMSGYRGDTLLAADAGGEPGTPLLEKPFSRAGLLERVAAALASP